MSPHVPQHFVDTIQRLTRVEEHCASTNATLLRLERKMGHLGAILREVENRSLVNRTRLAIVASLSGLVAGGAVSAGVKIFLG